MSVAPCLYVVHEAAAEAFQELQPCVPCLYAQVYVVPFWRHIAIDDSLPFTVVCHGINVYLLFPVVVVHVSKENPHPSILELEVIHHHVSRCFRLV